MEKIDIEKKNKFIERSNFFKHAELNIFDVNDIALLVCASLHASPITHSSEPKEIFL